MVADAWRRADPCRHLRCASAPGETHAGRSDLVSSPSMQFLEDLFAKAIAAAHPSVCLPPLLPEPPASGKLILLAAGKAAGSMIETAERHYLDEKHVPRERLAGIAVARHGYGRATRVIQMVEAGHPVPDEASLKSAARALELAQ